MASAPQTPAPSTSLPASSGKVSSEDIISQKVSEQMQGRPAQGSRRADWVRVRDTQTDLCISNAIVKTGIGFSSGVLISVLLFRSESSVLACVHMCVPC